MPTNDERREVAARLRKYTDFDFGDSNPYWYLMKAVYGDVAIHDDNELFDRLADLIEPLPERTCRNIHPDVFQCSECYAIDDDWKNPPYCHGCGAKVIE